MEDVHQADLRNDNSGTPTINVTWSDGKVSEEQLNDKDKN